VGAGAHGKLTAAARGEIVRTVQPREPRRYLAAPPGELARRVVARSELPFEFMLNALRLTRGFPLAWFGARTGIEVAAIEAPLASLRRRGLLIEAPGGYRPSELGLRFLNELLLEFMPETPKMSGAFGLSIPSGGSPGERSGPLFTATGRAAGE
jgi:coproporphyrinogen III oxidase-like Fe-S oxidoreductase